MPPSKRRLSATLLKPKEDQERGSAVVSAGRGGAWRAGLQADIRNDLEELQEQRGLDILGGEQVIELKPDQLEDRVGTDRREDWQDQQDYADLKDSIDKYGQDTPIEVWPINPNWRPTDKPPFVREEDRFELVTGRRRRLAAADLGIMIRAVILPRRHEPDSHQWQVLLRRYRENNHRANLSPFEKMLSVAEMFGAWKQTVSQPSIRQFGGAIGLDPSYVSRSVRLRDSEAALRQVFDDPYTLRYRELELWIAQHSEPKSDQSHRRAPAKPITLEVAGQKVHWKHAGGKLTLIIPGVADGIAPERFSGLLERFVEELAGSRRG